jgi:hypothetical protein
MWKQITGIPHRNPRLNFERHQIITITIQSWKSVWYKSYMYLLYNFYTIIHFEQSTYKSLQLINIVKYIPKYKQ